MGSQEKIQPAFRVQYMICIPYHQKVMLRSLFRIRGAQRCWELPFQSKTAIMGKQHITSTVHVSQGEGSTSSGIDTLCLQFLR
jgi:hypothetical protein